MKLKILSLIICSCFYISCYGQDTLLKKDGSEIKGKVLEVTTTSIKYKRLDNLGGPVYEIRKSDLFMIQFENGSKEVFGSVVQKTDSRNTQENQLKKSQSNLPKQTNLNSNSINLNILRLPFNPSFVSLGFELGLSNDLSLEFRAHYFTQRQDAWFPGKYDAWSSSELARWDVSFYELKYSKIGVGGKVKKYFSENNTGVYIGGSFDGQYILNAQEFFRATEPSFTSYYEADGFSLALAGAIGYKKWFSDNKFFVEGGIEGGYVLNLTDEYDDFYGSVETGRFSSLWLNPMVTLGFKL